MPPDEWSGRGRKHGFAIEARGLVKRYGAAVAVDGIDLRVRAGEVHGYLGPNGAGKTTSLRMLLGLIRPDAGTVRLFGRDSSSTGVRALDGVAGFVEEPRFYPYLSGRANLALMGALDGRAAGVRVEASLDAVGLRDRGADRVREYSQGMRQRLGIAAALIRAPGLLILDEPSNGLDPAGMRDMRALVRRLAEQEHITILLSSHQLQEVRQLCDAVTIISRGRAVFDGPLHDLMNGAGSTYDLRTTDDALAARIARALAGIEVTTEPGGLRVTTAGCEIARLSIALAEADVGIRALVPQQPDFEELFLRLTADGSGRRENNPVAAL